MKMPKVLPLTLCMLPLFAIAQNTPKDSYALIKRLIPQRASSFIIQPIAKADSGDVFELQSRQNKIVLRGNNGVAIASALYYYLTQYAHCQVTWNGTNLKLPALLPRIPFKVHKTSPYQYRYYLNYCTFNYSMSWWDWPRWEKEIDWMAMNGINIVYATTGMEYIFSKVCVFPSNKMSFIDFDVRFFFEWVSLNLN